jgi:hypothetical protein
MIAYQITNYMAGGSIVWGRLPQLFRSWRNAVENVNEGYLKGKPITITSNTFPVS